MCGQMEFQLTQEIQGTAGMYIYIYIYMQVHLQASLEGQINFVNSFQKMPF